MAGTFTDKKSFLENLWNIKISLEMIKKCHPGSILVLQIKKMACNLQEDILQLQWLVIF